MTGRKGRVVSNSDGTISYQSRSKQDVALELLNITEKERFMDGEKVFHIRLNEFFKVNCHSEMVDTAGWFCLKARLIFFFPYQHFSPVTGTKRF